MASHTPLLALLFALVSSAASFTAHATDPAASATPLAAGAPVFIVTSRETWDGVRWLAHDAQARRDGLGRELVVAELRADQLDAVSAYVHEQELRCGGYFAFASRAEADAFIAGDRTAEAIAGPLEVSYTIDNQATVDGWLPQVSDTGIYATIAQLSAYRNRYYASSHGRAAALWIRDTWAALAARRADASAELFEDCASCATQPSVILTVRGSALPDEVVVIGGHLDSISNASGGNERLAPGADDDASGIATITEVIRVALAGDWKPQRTVKFIGYAAEEIGLYGSNAIAQRFRADGVNVVGVLQLDMTNYKAGNGADMRVVTDFSSTALKTFLADLFDHYLRPLGLTRGTDTCGYACSDHASWTAAGYPAAMMFEAGNAATGAYFPNIHTVGDTLANMQDSAMNSAKFAKFALAFLGELAKTHADAPDADVLFKDGFDDGYGVRIEET
jgi:leucyl aminopeptidase